MSLRDAPPDTGWSMHLRLAESLLRELDIKGALKQEIESADLLLPTLVERSPPGRSRARYPG